MKWKERMLLIEEIGSLGHVSSFCFGHISKATREREKMDKPV